jgi:hypothetical protein
MKTKDVKAARELEDIPNIGKVIAGYLRLAGVTEPKELTHENGIELYHRVNDLTGKTQDPCMADVFMAAVDFMNGGEPKPWWKFTAERKAILKASSGRTRN